MLDELYGKIIVGASRTENEITLEFPNGDLFVIEADGPLRTRLVSIVAAIPEGASP